MPTTQASYTRYTVPIKLSHLSINENGTYAVPLTGGIGPELITNGGFDSGTTGWTADDSATLLSVANGENGNCLQITNGAAAYGWAYQAFTTVIGAVYTVRFWHKNGTGNGSLSIGTSSGGSTIYNGPNLADASGVVRTVTFTATATTTYLSFWINDNVSGHTTFYDGISCRQVTATSGQLLPFDVFDKCQADGSDIWFAAYPDGTNPFPVEIIPGSVNVVNRTCEIWIGVPLYVTTDVTIWCGYGSKLDAARQGTAASFVAADKSYLSSQSQVTIGTSDISFSLLVKHTSLANYGTLARIGSWGLGGIFLQSQSDGSLNLQFTDGVGTPITPNVAPAGSLVTGVLQSVVVTFSRIGNATCYINGTQVGYAIISTLQASIPAAGILFGGIGGDGYYFNGSLDHLRIWSRTLTPTEIARQANMLGGVPYARPYSQLSTDEKVGLVSAWELQETVWDATHHAIDVVSGNNLTFQSSPIISGDTGNGNFETWTDLNHASSFNNRITGDYTINKESTPANVHGGTYSLRIDLGTSGSANLTIGITAGKTYTTTGWAKATAPMYLTFGPDDYPRNQAIILLTTSWTQYTTVGVDNPIDPIFYIGTRGDTNCSVYIDDVTVSAANLLSTPGPYLTSNLSQPLQSAAYGSQAVWSAVGNVMFVSHNGGITDSTGNQTPVNHGVTTPSGYIGSAGAFSVKAYAAIGSISASHWTLESWVYPATADYSSARRIFAQDGYQIDWAFFPGYSATYDGGWKVLTGCTPVLNAWSFAAVAYTGSGLTCVMNAVSNSVSGGRALSGNSYIGTATGNNAVESWQGSLDEVRISSVARSANYLATDYALQVSNISTTGTPIDTAESIIGTATFISNVNEIRNITYVATSSVAQNNDVVTEIRNTTYVVATATFIEFTGEQTKTVYTATQFTFDDFVTDRYSVNLLSFRNSVIVDGKAIVNGSEIVSSINHTERDDPAYPSLQHTAISRHTDTERQFLTHRMPLSNIVVSDDTDTERQFAIHNVPAKQVVIINGKSAPV